MANPISTSRIRTLDSSAAVVPNPNELTPEEIAEFDAKEALAAAPVPPATPVEPPAAAPAANPAPAVAATPAPAEPPVPEPAADPDALTPAEEAEFDAKEAAANAAPQTGNIAEELTAAELAEMAVKDPTFDMMTEFRQNVPPRSNTATLAESQKYNKLLEKFATADQILRERGFKWEDRPSLGQIGSSLKGFAVGIGKYVKPFIDVGAHPLPDPNNPMEADPLQYAKSQRGIAESGAGTEASVGGLGELARKISGEFGRRIGQSKPLSEWTLDDKVKAFTNKLKRGEASEQVLKGQGAAMQAIGGALIEDLATKGLPIRPEEVAAKSAGDPVALWAFGSGMRLAGGMVPRYVKAGVAKATQSAVDIAPKIVGGGIEVVAKGVGGGAKIIEKVAPTAGTVAGAVKGASIGGVGGAFVGAGAGRAGGVGIAKGAAAVRDAAEKVAEFGRQVASEAPLAVGADYAQLVRNVAQAIPGAAVATGEGLLFDVGLAAVSSESPEDTKGAIGVGTALGAIGGLGHMTKKMVSGQLIAPRSYGIDKPVSTSKQAAQTFVDMHNAAWAEKTPAERANLNATRKFIQEGVGSDADLFVGKDAAAVKAALIAEKMPEARAEQLSQVPGFFMAEFPGKDGNLRKVIIVRDVTSAPHESFHGVQDVLGEPANRVLDELVKKAHVDDFDAIGQRYTERFGEIPEGKTWEEVLLDKSGWGRVELVDKMTRELTASNEAQGNPPNPTLINRLVMQEITRLQTEKGGDPQNVWNGELSAEEAKTIADRYVAREIGAETFDMVFKSRGRGLAEGNSLPQKFARVAAALITALGGNPLEGALSEIQQLQPKPEVVAAVAEAASGRLPAPKPGESFVTPRTPAAPPARPGAPGKGIPATPEQIAEAAADAQQVADAAPDTIAPGALASPRELLGTVAEAIASRDGIKINYRSAPGEPAAATTGNRTVRRAVVEAFRTMPEAARALWEKNFFPERVILTKGGKYQISGWAPEVFASNAHKMAKALIDARKGDLAPYPLDPTTGSFTPEGWQRLYEDTQIFVENQVAGRTGSGVELVVPREVVEAGGYKPPVVGEAKPLEQGAADFINMLFNFRIPDTPRMVAGKRPLNIQGQEVSAATIPGRLEQPMRPRAPFEGQEAVAQGIVGREILEVNPTRGAVERALGEQMPSLNDVRQNLNLEHINDVTIASEQPQFRGNTLTLSAGMQAPRGKGYAADEMWLGRDKLNPAPEGHQKWASDNFPGEGTHTAANAYDRAKNAGYLRVVQSMGALSVDASTKYPTWESVPRKYKEALEARAIDSDVRVVFDGKQVIGKFRPGDGGVQFQAQTETGKKFEKDGFTFRVAHPDQGAYTIEVMRNNEQVAVLESSLVDEKTASIDWVRVIPEFRKQGLSEVMYRELGARLQKSGIETVTGTLIAEGPGQTRRKVFGEPEVVPVEELKGTGRIQVNSRIDPKVQFSPKRWEGRPTKTSVDDILAMPASEWTVFMRDYKSDASDSATGIAIDIGKLAKTPEDLLALKVGEDMAGERYRAARAAGDLYAAMAEAMRKQTFSEAIQTAEDSRPILKELQKKSQLPKE